MEQQGGSRGILIVEDSDDDYEATIRALRRGKKMSNPIHRCSTGQEALDYLRREGSYAEEAPERPMLVLLDLNMPGLDGRDVLAAMKDDPDLMKIPVIVMTTSSDPVDIDECYRRGANSYVVKPVSWSGFVNAIERLTEYWLEISLLPTERP